MVGELRIDERFASDRTYTAKIKKYIAFKYVHICKLNANHSVTRLLHQDKGSPNSAF